MSSRTMISPPSGQSGYGSVADHSHVRQQSWMRRPARIVFGMCCSLVLFLVVMSGHLRNKSVDLAQVLDDSVDVDYLKAEASGKSGKEFLKKLQEMWFVAQYR